jgi:hypothetical protein
MPKSDDSTTGSSPASTNSDHRDLTEVSMPEKEARLRRALAIVEGALARRKRGEERPDLLN